MLVMAFLALVEVSLFYLIRLLAFTICCNPYTTKSNGRDMIILNLWSDWVNLEVCNPTHHVYGIVALAVSITVISDASPLQHNDIVLAGWRDQPTKQPSPTDSAS